MRWLSDFEADGPLPLQSTFDRGGELSASYFVVPKKTALYGRGSCTGSSATRMNTVAV
jgi:hypothetical protein